MCRCSVQSLQTTHGLLGATPAISQMQTCADPVCCMSGVPFSWSLVAIISVCSGCVAVFLYLAACMEEVCITLAASIMLVSLRVY